VSRTPEFVIVSEAIKAVRQGLNGKSDAIVRLIESEAWRAYEMPTPLRPVITADTFVEFVTRPFEDGVLGTDVETLKRLCRHNRHALDLVQRETKRPGGRPKKTETVDIVNGKRPTGNDPSAALRRLAKDRPDLHARVLAGDLSPHAAAIEAGHRTRTITVPLDVERAAATLRRHFSEDDLRRLLDVLDPRVPPPPSPPGIPPPGA
jgi:hypothetical protein